MAEPITQCPMAVMGTGHMGSMWLGGLIWNVLLILIIIGVLYWLIRGSSAVKESPEEIAKRRFASGEITKAEYEEILKEIRR